MSGESNPYLSPAPEKPDDHPVVDRPLIRVWVLSFMVWMLVGTVFMAALEIRKLRSQQRQMKEVIIDLATEKFAREFFK